MTNIFPKMVIYYGSSSVKNHQLNKPFSSSFRICRVLLYRVYIPGLGYVANLPMVKTTSYPPGPLLTIVALLGMIQGSGRV